MSYEITHHEVENFIAVKLLVDFNWPVMDQIIPIVSKLVIEKDCRNILLDFRSADLDLSTLKIYQTPDKLREGFAKHGIELLHLKRALLITSNDQNHHFFETVMINRGHNFKIFFERQSALDWFAQP